MIDYKEKFNKFGFLILRNVFDQKQCETFKKEILKFYFGEENKSFNYYAPNYRDGKQTVCPLAFNFEKLQSLLTIFDNIQLNKVLKELTDNKLLFLHHSDAHVDTVAGKGWHRDTDWQLKNHDNKINIWDDKDNEKYCVIRIALYLQDHHLDTNGLYIRAGSHKKEGPSKEFYAKTRTGDVILFDSRLYHKGGHSGRKKDYRAAIYWAMGRDNIFSHQHIEAQLQRQKRQLGIEDYEINHELKKRLIKNGIGF